MKKLMIAASAAAFLATPAMAGDGAKKLQDAFVAAVVAEDAAALAALYTDDAVSYGPDGGVAEGRDAIAASWAPFFADYDEFTLELDQKGESAMKNKHAAWGLWTMSAAATDGAERVVWKGRFMDVSVKTKDGWLYQADHASMSAPEEDAAAAE